ncbi:MAG: hypothetical protein ACR2NX_06110 [Chthoniobacterales bacterium]
MEKHALEPQTAPRSHYGAIAGKIEAQPELLAIPLANIGRWLAQAHSAPHRLEQWRALLVILRDHSEEATPLR